MPPPERFLDDLFTLGRDGPTLAGFDFPIGLPAHYGLRSEASGFPVALLGFAADFYSVAECPEDVSQARPFYPARPGCARRQHLLDALDAPDMASLTRACERAGPGLKAAGCLFWTLGAAQVGKAALHGWRHVIAPARLRGARLWPFDGALRGAGRGGLTLAETYPADGYARLGAAFRPGRESKRRQADRAGKSAAIEAWAERRGVDLAPALRAAVQAGFGPQDRGGDRFDAVVGLLAMIDILAGPEAGSVPDAPMIRAWEGWILGRPPHA